MTSKVEFGNPEHIELKKKYEESMDIEKYSDAQTKRIIECQNCLDTDIKCKLCNNYISDDGCYCNSKGSHLCNDCYEKISGDECGV